MSRSGLICECDSPEYRHAELPIINNVNFCHQRSVGVVWLHDGDMVWRE